MRNTIVIIILLHLYACSSGDKSKYYKDKPNMPEQRGENITMVYTDSGDLRAKMLSPLVEHYNANKSNPLTLMSKGILVYFYKEDKSHPNSKLKANYATRFEQKQLIELKNDIEVVNEEGDTLNTEYLLWDEKTRMITSNAFVRIKKKKEILYGEGFESNEDFSKYKIFKIKGTIYRDRAEIE